MFPAGYPYIFAVLTNRAVYSKNMKFFEPLEPGREHAVCNRDGFLKSFPFNRIHNVRFINMVTIGNHFNEHIGFTQNGFNRTAAAEVSQWVRTAEEAHATGPLDPDWPVAGFYNVLVSNVQNLMNGQDPSKFLDALATAYNSGKPSI